MAIIISLQMYAYKDSCSAAYKLFLNFVVHWICYRASVLNSILFLMSVNFIRFVWNTGLNSFANWMIENQDVIWWTSAFISSADSSDCLWYLVTNACKSILIDIIVSTISFTINDLHVSRTEIWRSVNCNQFCLHVTRFWDGSLLTVKQKAGIEHHLIANLSLSM